MSSTDSGEFEQLSSQMYRDHHLGLRVFLLKRLGESDLVDEVIQQTFYKLERHLEQLRQDGRTAELNSSWLFRVALNEASLIKRKEQRVRKHSPRLGIFMEQLRRTSSDPLVAEEEAAAIWEEVQAIPEKHREVLLMRIQEDMKYEEIAERLKLPLGTVNSRMARAIKQLSESLKKRFDVESELRFKPKQ